MHWYTGGAVKVSEDCLLDKMVVTVILIGNFPF